jgi:hypothetical protein
VFERNLAKIDGEQQAGIIEPPRWADYVQVLLWPLLQARELLETGIGTLADEQAQTTDEIFTAGYAPGWLQYAYEQSGGTIPQTKKLLAWFESVQILPETRFQERVYQVIRRRLYHQLAGLRSLAAWVDGYLPPESPDDDPDASPPPDAGDGPSGGDGAPPPAAGHPGAPVVPVLPGAAQAAHQRVGGQVGAPHDEDVRAAGAAALVPLAAAPPPLLGLHLESQEQTRRSTLAQREQEPPRCQENLQ